MDGLTCATFPQLSAEVLQDTTVFYRKKVANSHFTSTVADVTEILSLGPPAGIIVTACLLCGARYEQEYMQVQPLLSKWCLMCTHTVTKNHVNKMVRIAARARN